MEDHIVQVHHIAKPGVCPPLRLPKEPPRPLQAIWPLSAIISHLMRSHTPIRDSSATSTSISSLISFSQNRRSPTDCTTNTFRLCTCIFTSFFYSMLNIGVFLKISGKIINTICYHVRKLDLLYVYDRMYCVLLHL